MNELALFAKHWRRAPVKTRLAVVLGEDRACDLYLCLLRTSLRRFAPLGDRRYVVYAPPESGAAFRKLIGRRAWSLRAQVSGDLGTRLRQDVDQSFATGTQRLVIIGADSPTLPLERLEQAFAFLRSNDVVLGPSDDGGYYLIGLRRAVPEIFDGIDWGTDRVWSQTMERLRSIAARVAVLPPWYDIDRDADLNRLVDELRSGAPLDPSLRTLARCLERALGG
jgi:rSAM/selenodomain-associated transferase 1